MMKLLIHSQPSTIVQSVIYRWWYPFPTFKDCTKYHLQVVVSIPNLKRLYKVSFTGGVGVGVGVDDDDDDDNKAWVPRETIGSIGNNIHLFGVDVIWLSLNGDNIMRHLKNCFVISTVNSVLVGFLINSVPGESMEVCL